jgi:hypothetical protein
MINGHTTPIFDENSHERPFSIIPKANTYGFLTNKWSPPKIQECGLWQGNICGVRCMSLWSMINGHTTPIFVKNSYERPFSIIPKANTYEFVGVSRPGGPSGRRVSVAVCPSLDGSSAKGGRSEAVEDRRERGGNPAAFVFVPRPGRVRLQ